MSRTRQFIAWFCMAASLWMGAGYQIHSLSHAVHALHDHEAAHDHEGEHDHGNGHAALCEQCGLFAVLEGAVPSAQAVSLPALPPGRPWPASAAPARAFSFTAYASRAPPAFT